MVAPAAPSPTTASTLATVLGLAALAPRQTAFPSGSYTYTNYYGDSCGYANAIGSCLNYISSCDFNSAVTATDYGAIDSAITSCYCTYGISYLNCVFSQVSTGSCANALFGGFDYEDYQTEYYSSYCGSVPPSVMAQLRVPQTVDVSFYPNLKTVTATGVTTTPRHTDPPLYAGNGNLLAGKCTSTDFTLVDAGATVYLAGFLGCNNNRPECCPWKVATDTAQAAASAGSNRIDFPLAADSAQQVLSKCADDYYSISGGCCPNGYWPFTRAIGGKTPCWSSNRAAAATTPTLTRGLEGQPSDTTKPTSAVINIVWSMRYEVASADGGSGGLSTAAKAGIGAGAGVAVILIATLALCLWRARRKNKKPQTTPVPPPPGQQPPMQNVAPNDKFPASGYATSTQPPSSYAPSGVTGVSPMALAPQHTGASGGAVSHMSSLSGQNMPPNGQGYYGNPRTSMTTSSGTGSPAVAPNGQLYQAPIAEADEGHGHGYPQQYGYHQGHQELAGGFSPPQGQAPPQHQQFYGQPQSPPPPGQQLYAPPQQQQSPPPQGQQYYAPPQGQPQQQPQLVYSAEAGGYVHQQQPPYQSTSPPPSQVLYQPQPHSPQQHVNVPEMSARRETEPPQEVMGSHVQPPPAQLPH
ncbi:hypothetical protein B0H63DRAFT_526832 [Podospora didyma]|uniref:Uncharacterized protein n=1 Tax=Podospora didyma TaxID=330526 RepID=A0AAE0N760_9PEZI|nr:hypothetical protein B0H63DRAFT_526832 [Podospora didyma]